MPTSTTSTRIPPPLGDLTSRTFLRMYWGKHAHVIRQAVPAFQGLLDRTALFALATRDDVESRLIVHEGRHWSLEHGPFRRRDLAGLPPTRWTLLVQGLDLHSDEGARLLRRFDFVPRARLDDLMVSHAAPGGGVGPHFDSYDVFLLQGRGRRRWRVSTQTDLTLRQDVPLKILRRFRAEAEWILEPGDMLYLPPRYAHDGVALDECQTYSIGFRAPAFGELVAEFLMRFGETVTVPGRYSDPDLAPTRHPGRVPKAMTRSLAETLQALRWSRTDIEEFLGRYLSEPKPHVFFSPAERPVSPALFARRLASRPLTLHRKSIMLYSDRSVFLNGECYRFPRGTPEWLRTLADTGTLPPAEPARAVVELLREWHRCGYIEFLAA
ncbi:MAG: cupin domain-containing protein [Betaproteobacteria bacterium]|nr:cupin domain-containing protein [Betaproteobacteria bacterium]